MPTEQEEIRKVLRKAVRTAKKQRDILKKFDLDAEIKSGRLIPTSKAGWYEIVGDPSKITEAVGILASGLQQTKAGRTKIKLGKRDRLLRALEKLARFDL